MLGLQQGLHYESVPPPVVLVWVVVQEQTSYEMIEGALVSLLIPAQWTYYVSHQELLPSDEDQHK